MTDSGTNNPNDPSGRDVSEGDTTCQAARDIVHRRIDAETSGEELARLDAHLGRCDACSRYAAEIAGVMSQVVALRDATELPPAATGQPIDRNINDGRRPRFAPTWLRVAAVIAFGFAGLWAWSTSQDRSSVQFVDVGPGFVGTNAIDPQAGISNSVNPSPAMDGNGHSSAHMARIINPRSEGSTYITVERDTGRTNVKMFALYERVQ